MNLDCNQCIINLYKMTGGSTIGILSFKEAIASTAIEKDCTAEELESIVLDHHNHQ